MRKITLKAIITIAFLYEAAVAARAALFDSGLPCYVTGIIILVIGFLWFILYMMIMFVIDEMYS